LLGKDLRERGFSDADGPFDDDMAGRFESRFTHGARL
jgi:hypothetical protein